MDEPQGFREFVRVRSTDLLRSAWLLTGDWHTAQDLVQTALMKTWPRWDMLARRDQPEFYVRRVMLTTYLSWRQRRWVGEVPVSELPEPASVDNGALDSDVRRSLLAALTVLPPRQRAVIVLRYFDDLTEAETARALGCSVGAVKTHSSRALAHLRAMPELAPAFDSEVL